jgi:hypothetical protein
MGEHRFTYPVVIELRRVVAAPAGGYTGAADRRVRRPVADQFDLGQRQPSPPALDPGSGAKR